MIINLVFANNAPASFKAAVQQAAAILDAAITDPITVTIKIGYGVYPDGSNSPITNGSAEGGPNDGALVPYSQVVGDLVANAATGDPNFTWLSSASTISANTDVIVWPAELKALGSSSLIPAADNGIDGFAGFATDISANALVGVALHELTHAMGRVPSGPPDFNPQPDIFDLFRFTSPSHQLISDNIPEVAAYFSVNGGVTHLAAYGRQSDPSDFLNATVTQNDAFAEFYTPGATDQFLTPVDLTQLDTLGFTTLLAWANGISGDFADAAYWSPNAAPQFNDILITASGTYVVSSFLDETIDSLTMAAGATLDIGSGTFTIDNGTVSGTTSGTIDVAAGATLVLDGTFRNAGTINVLGGTIDLSGTISGTGVDEIGSGGTLVVTSGGLADLTLLLSGGTEIISSGGSDVGALISGGEQDVFGLATGASVFGGSQVIEAGGAASGTIVSSGGMVLVNSGAKLTGAVVSSGGTEIVSAGGSDVGAKISGGEQDVFGLASGATVFAGYQVIEAGGVASGTTVSSGGIVVLNAGATLISAAVRSGGTEIVEAEGHGHRHNA